jgi:hypothetical protein
VPKLANPTLVHRTLVNRTRLPFTLDSREPLEVKLCEKPKGMPGRRGKYGWPVMETLGMTRPGYNLVLVSFSRASLLPS